MYKPFVAIDQFGSHIWLKAHPRKELMEHFGRQSARKMYRDVDGQAHHVGYVVGPHWCEVVRVMPFKSGPEGGGNSDRAAMGSAA